jgi:hypothetical protein
MKLHELFEQKVLLEDAVTLPEVMTLGDLKDPKTGKYYTSEVNVIRGVDIKNMQLTALPVKFGKVGWFNCGRNKLTSLKGSPNSVGSDFYCFDNALTSLDGAPQSTGRYFECNNNKITSLEGIHKIIKKIGDTLFCSRNPIISGGIGVILIEGLKKIEADQPAFKIINRYVGQGKKGLLRCQDELIEAGLEEFAKL